MCRIPVWVWCHSPCKKRQGLRHWTSNYGVTPLASRKPCAAVGQSCLSGLSTVGLFRSYWKDGKSVNTRNRRHTGLHRAGVTPLRNSVTGVTALAIKNARAAPLDFPIRRHNTRIGQAVRRWGYRISMEYLLAVSHSLRFERIKALSDNTHPPPLLSIGTCVKCG